MDLFIYLFLLQWNSSPKHTEALQFMVFDVQRITKSLNRKTQSLLRRLKQTGLHQLRP